MTTSRADLAATMDRLVATLKPPPGARERMYRCHVCRDTGWRELEPGETAITHGDDRDPGGRVTVQAQTGAGLVERCKGPSSTACPYALHRRKTALERAAHHGDTDDREATFS